MSSAISLLAMFAGCGAALFAATPALRVCADPNNLPYSNDQQLGFENELARMIAADFNLQVSYTWFAQRGAFFRKTLDAGLCDLVMGVPSGMENVSTTRPYYRSGYVFVSRRDRNLNIHSLDDPRLRQLHIGVHILGDGDSSLPPVHMLTTRGLVHNLVGYSIFGNLDESNPPSDLIKAVEKGDVDLAVAWGPMAGYFSLHSSAPLALVSIDNDPLSPALPLAFDIAIGVRPKDQELKVRLDAELVRRRPEITRLLESYGIPQQAFPQQAQPARANEEQ
jgi:quinoprotein dehydrogenase-associated probable ABC transporter substrate-binding protein